MFERCIKNWLTRKDDGRVCRFNGPRDESLNACSKEREHSDIIRAEAIGNEEAPQEMSGALSYRIPFFAAPLAPTASNCQKVGNSQCTAHLRAK